MSVPNNSVQNGQVSDLVLALVSASMFVRSENSINKIWGGNASAGRERTAAVTARSRNQLPTSTDSGEHRMTFLKTFVRDEQGQDLIEYTLLMAFVALASAALFIGAGGSISSIWTNSNAQLTTASS
jgi:Flp pilus assembly pilin Flp